MKTLIDTPENEPNDPTDPYEAYRVEYRRLIDAISIVLRRSGSLSTLVRGTR